MVSATDPARERGRHVPFPADIIALKKRYWPTQADKYTARRRCMPKSNTAATGSVTSAYAAPIYCK
jgi:hypothetical protein